MLNFNTSKPMQYFVYLSLFVIGQSLSMWGQYVTLPYICKYITVFHEIHEDEIELALFTNSTFGKG